MTQRLHSNGYWGDAKPINREKPWQLHSDEVEFMASARDQLRALPKDARRLIGRKIDCAQTALAGDVKKLKGFKNKYRLRAGNYRVLFELEGPVMVVYGVGDRKDIYE